MTGTDTTDRERSGAPATPTRRLTIRVGRLALAFSEPAGGGTVTYDPYNLKSGMSMAANLREAVKARRFTPDTFCKVTALVDSPVLLVPNDLFEEKERELLFHNAFPDTRGDIVMSNVLVSIGSVAVFAAGKDLCTVINDTFRHVTFIPVMAPVWRYLYGRSFTGTDKKLYAYFHDGKMEVFAFTRHRFKYSNAFDADNAGDALYFLLYVWKELELSQEHDSLYIAGSAPDAARLTAELKKFIRKTYTVNPAGDFNRAPVTQIKDMPYDLMTLYVKGR